MKKIGIFSGTFDPIHVGHMDFARQAVERFTLDELLILVELNPRRKENVSEYKDRLEMVKLATKEDSKIHADKSKVQLEGRTHSVDETLDEISSHYKEQIELYVLMGSDVFEHLPQWKNFERLLKETKLVVALKEEDDGEDVVRVNLELGAKLSLISSSYPKVSSSKIRNAIAGGGKPEGLDEEVQKYITECNLYEKI